MKSKYLIRLCQSLIGLCVAGYIVSFAWAENDSGVPYEQSADEFTVSEGMSALSVGPVIQPIITPTDSGEESMIANELGPVLYELTTPPDQQSKSLKNVPVLVPLLNAEPKSNNLPVLPGFVGSEKDKNAEEKASTEAKRQTPAKMLSVDQHPKVPEIAILIDDLGYNRHGMESSLSLPVNVALAILPGTPFSVKTAKAALKQKRITLLHAPMENERELKLGPGGLYAKMSEKELKAVLVQDISELPGIQGVNNHMGSLLTGKQNAMNWVMEVLKERSLFFIDSLTSPQSVAQKTALKYGLKTGSRDVFLDNIRTEKAIDRQFSRLLKLAKRHGSALAIGHPYPETMAYLSKRLAELKNDGIELVPLSMVLKSQIKE